MQERIQGLSSMTVATENMSKEDDRKRRKPSTRIIPVATLTHSIVFLLASIFAFDMGTILRTSEAFILPVQICPLRNERLLHGKLYAATSSEAATNSKATVSSFKRPDVVSLRSESLAEVILGRIKDQSAKLGKEHAEMFGLDESDKEEEKLQTSAAMFALLDAIKHTLGADGGLGLSGHPFVLRKAEIERVIMEDEESSSTTIFEKFFTIGELKLALEDDFLDAQRGSTDNRKGWSVSPVSIPKGDSFEEARMTYEDVQKALEKGTVIFNAFGAHVPRLAGPCLAVTDATDTPNAVNLYVTAYGKRTSAPPHTDKQDVLVVQTNGKKVRFKILFVSSKLLNENSALPNPFSFAALESLRTHAPFRETECGRLCPRKGD